MCYLLVHLIIDLNDDDEENALDVLENGMIKKKARTSEWNARASAQK